MDDPIIRTLLVCGVFALIFGPLTARSALRREPVHSGLPAQILNLLAAMSMTAVIPGLISSIIFGAGALRGLTIGLSFMALTFIFTVLFAIVERPALERHDAQGETDTGWTEADARSSGL